MTMTPAGRFLGVLLGLASGCAAAQTNVTNTNNGTTNAIPVYTGSATLGNSPISISGSNVGIGTTSPLATLDINGGLFVRGYTTTNTSSSYGGQWTQLGVCTVTVQDTNISD